MKFLPTLRPLALLGLALSFAACSTPANRRELYTVSDGNGPWHDYERRLDASSQTGVAPGDMGHAAPGSEMLPTIAPGGNNTGGTTIDRSSRPTRQPKSSPLPADTTLSPSGQPAPAAPANVPVPTSPTTSDPTNPANPGGATTAPAADPTSVPVVPPTT